MDYTITKVKNKRIRKNSKVYKQLIKDLENGESKGFGFKRSYFKSGNSKSIIFSKEYLLMILNDELCFIVETISDSGVRYTIHIHSNHYYKFIHLQKIISK